MKKAETVKLISAEGFEFIVDQRAASVSNTIKVRRAREKRRAWTRAAMPSLRGDSRGPTPRPPTRTCSRAKAASRRRSLGR